MPIEKRNGLDVPHQPPLRRVALLVDTSHGVGRQISAGILRYAQTHLSWRFYFEPRGIQDAPPQWIKSWEGDGIIAGLSTPAMRHAVRSSGLPAVDVMGGMRSAGIPLIRLNNATVAHLAAEHLLDLGLSSFAFCHTKHMNWSAELRDAFVSHLKSAGYPCRVFNQEPHFRDTTWNWDAEQEELATWLLSLPNPTGIMVCADRRAPDIIEACHSVNIAIPDDIALIGAGNDKHICELCSPQLSSVDTNAVQIGHAAAMLLDKMMSHIHVSGETIMVEPRNVHVRRSSEMLAIEDSTIAAAVRFIREQGCSGIQVEDVARHVGVSQSILRRKFKDVLGRSVRDELIGARINKALFLLRESNMSIRDVAQAAGFKHQEYMGAMLKAKLGATPLQYRKSPHGYSRKRFQGKGG